MNQENINELKNLKQQFFFDNGLFKKIFRGDKH